ncbi:MAG: DUF2809 domain-containing protein [Gemmatimonadota bacterium]
MLTVGIGLAVHFGGHGLPGGLRDPLGDALWAAMVYWIVSALSPTASPLGRSLAAIAFSYVVEFSQLYHSPWLDGLRATVLGQLVLGSGFDARDLPAYAVGVAIAATIDRITFARSSTETANSSVVTRSERSSLPSRSASDEGRRSAP